MECKGGDTYNGRLVSADSWMNMNLTEVICTSRDGDRFEKLKSCYIRGSAIKYLRLPPDLLEKAAEIQEQEARSGRGAGRNNAPRGGGRGGRGRGGGGGGGVRVEEVEVVEAVAEDEAVNRQAGEP